MNPLPFIHGYTLADLQNMGMTAAAFHRPTADAPTGSPLPLSIPAHSPSTMEEPGSASLTLTPSQNPKSKIVNRRRPRSKACRLPKEIQLNLNTMLARGCRYRDIIHSLNGQATRASTRSICTTGASLVSKLAEQHSFSSPVIRSSAADATFGTNRPGAKSLSQKRSARSLTFRLADAATA